MFHLEQHLRKLFGALDALKTPFYSNERRKSTLRANDNYLAQNQTFSHNQKYCDVVNFTRHIERIEFSKLTGLTGGVMSLGKKSCDESPHFVATREHSKYTNRALYALTLPVPSVS